MNRLIGALRRCVSPVLCRRIIVYRTNFPLQRRLFSTNGDFEAVKKILAEHQGSEAQKMIIGFTCKSCSTRSHHMMGKLAYTKGTVIIQCPGCQQRHLISDHLNWFDHDHRLGKKTIEEILEERGEPIQRSLDGQSIEIEPEVKLVE